MNIGINDDDDPDRGQRNVSEREVVAIAMTVVRLQAAHPIEKIEKNGIEDIAG